MNPTKVDSAVALLREAAAKAPAAFSTSLSVEDMVLLDLIDRHALAISVFTLDTGRLPEETYELLSQLESRYQDKGTPRIAVYFPDAERVQALVAEQGMNGFYDSVDKRKACCAVRKIEPLGRALAGKAAWVTGMRAAQSVTRATLRPKAPDADYGLTKFNPLHDWTEADVWDYVRANDVPTNALHAKGYASIGCAPCTRAITVGEDIRAGRWWWEDADTKECGLHTRKSIPIAVKESA